MRLNLSNTASKPIVSGSKEKPLDVTIQNLSLNLVYVAYNPLSGVNNGIKIAAGASYTNDALTETLHAISDVDGSEIDFEVQASWITVLMGPRRC